MIDRNSEKNTKLYLIISKEPIFQLNNDLNYVKDL